MILNGVPDVQRIVESWDTKQIDTYVLSMFATRKRRHSFYIQSFLLYAKLSKPRDVPLPVMPYTSLVYATRPAIITNQSLCQRHWGQDDHICPGQLQQSH